MVWGEQFEAHKGLSEHPLCLPAYMVRCETEERDGEKTIRTCTIHLLTEGVETTSWKLEMGNLSNRRPNRVLPVECPRVYM